uniref:Uncharacterized protein n=1 Tax=Arundo donax TaxID=35708 RepID=A0A0A9H6X9_ARUDO
MAPVMGMSGSPWKDSLAFCTSNMKGKGNEVWVTSLGTASINFMEYRSSLGHAGVK